MPFLSAGVYGENGVYQVILEDGDGKEGIRYDKDISVFTFTVKIRDAREKIIRAGAGFRIRCLNEAAEE